MMINRRDGCNYKPITQCVRKRQYVSAQFLSDFLSLEACRLWRLPSRLPIRKEKEGSLNEENTDPSSHTHCQVSLQECCRDERPHAVSLSHPFFPFLSLFLIFIPIFSLLSSCPALHLILIAAWSTPSPSFSAFYVHLLALSITLFLCVCGGVCLCVVIFYVNFWVPLYSCQLHTIIYSFCDELTIDRNRKDNMGQQV